MAVLFKTFVNFWNFQPISGQTSKWEQPAFLTRRAEKGFFGLEANNVLTARAERGT